MLLLLLYQGLSVTRRGNEKPPKENVMMGVSLDIIPCNYEHNSFVLRLQSSYEGHRLHKEKCRSLTREACHRYTTERGSPKKPTPVAHQLSLVAQRIGRPNRGIEMTSSQERAKYMEDLTRQGIAPCPNPYYNILANFSSEQAVIKFVEKGNNNSFRAGG
ncbi:hypothetical protein J6590_032765 [Homalodisca vitripennis]|nr:hypothetical protein J6590_032765 [Homalodisca vitripennis]